MCLSGLYLTWTDGWLTLISLVLCMWLLFSWLRSPIESMAFWFCFSSSSSSSFESLPSDLSSCDRLPWDWFPLIVFCFGETLSIYFICLLVIFFVPLEIGWCLCTLFVTSTRMFWFLTLSFSFDLGLSSCCVCCDFLGEIRIPTLSKWIT